MSLLSFSGFHIVKPARIGLFLLLCSMLSVASHAQDTLLFRHHKRPHKTIGIPLNAYEVKVKPKGEKKMRVILTNYEDSSLTMKVWTFKGKAKKAKREEINAVYRQHPVSSSMTEDSLQERFEVVDSLREDIQYSEVQTIAVVDIDKVIIENRYRPEMSRIASAAEWGTFTWIVFGIPAIAVIRTLAYFATWSAVGVGIVTLVVVTANKSLKMSRWEVDDRMIN